MISTTFIFSTTYFIQKYYTIYLWWSLTSLPSSRGREWVLEIKVQCKALICWFWLVSKMVMEFNSLTKPSSFVSNVSKNRCSIMLLSWSTSQVKAGFVVFFTWMFNRKASKGIDSGLLSLAGFVISLYLKLIFKYCLFASLRRCHSIGIALCNC